MSPGEWGTVPVVHRPDHRTLVDRTANSLRDAIGAEVYHRGEQLPPEHDLCDLMKVSRTTLREALRTLEIQGLIVRKRGLGTFVSSDRIVKDLSKNFGITEMIATAGLKPGTASAKCSLARASGIVAEELQVADGTEVVSLDRVRSADGIPVVWSIDYFPTQVVLGHDLAAFEAPSLSLYDFLESNLRILVRRGVATLRPVTATEDVAARLGVQEGDPILLISQTDLDEDNRPVMFSVEYHLADKVKFIVHRQGPSF